MITASQLEPIFTSPNIVFKPGIIFIKKIINIDNNTARNSFGFDFGLTTIELVSARILIM